MARTWGEVRHEGKALKLAEEEKEYRFQSYDISKVRY